MRFSERLGFKPVREQLQVDSIDERLKNSLWNAFYKIFYQIKENRRIKAASIIWSDYLNKTLDDGPFYLPDNIINESSFIGSVKKYYYDPNRKWYEIYDFIEFIAKFTTLENKENTYLFLNNILETEKSAYRFVEFQLVRLTSEEEVQSIEESLSGSENKYKGVNTHLKTALTLLSDRESPDYRNSIKESISAVESLCKSLVGNDKARVSNAIKLLKEQHNSHPALLDAFNKLYGYTSDGDGIRHAIMDDGNELDFHDAKYMLVTCSAFINLMIGKLEK